MYFTGDLDARLVLVHLNPKQTDDPAPRFQGPPPVNTFEEYFDIFRNWGARFYGVGTDREFMSRFDRKQIRFLRPFGAIDFDASDSGESIAFCGSSRPGLDATFCSAARSSSP